MTVKRMIIASIALCATGVALPRCLPPPDGRVSTATRCGGEHAEVCDGVASPDHTCVPLSVCLAPSDGGAP